MDDHQRCRALLDAEAKAQTLFDTAVERGLIVAGKGERQLSDEVRDLARELFDIRKFWHKRIVRSGVNTLEPYRSNPPDRMITEDDIVFLDFGPILEDWEADFGRTYVLGNDPAKHALADALEPIWIAGQRYFHEHPEITGEQLFTYMREHIAQAGFGHATEHAGHLVGEFPHERINGDEIESYITPGSVQPMRRPDAVGNPCHWILEVHLVDPTGSFGAFFEQLLDIPDAHGGPVRSANFETAQPAEPRA